MIIDNIEYNDVDVAWAAGLFEGEGCLYTTGKTGITAQVCMTDQDVIQKFRDILGFGNIEGPIRDKHFKEHYKDQYRWRTSNKNSIDIIYQLFLPYLGSRRRGKFEELRYRLIDCRFGKRKGFSGAALRNFN